MKTKIVLWGEKEQEEKVLLGIELIENDNLIRIHSVQEKDATETFYNQLMNQWREGQDLIWPESVEITDRPLSMTEGLLPDEIRTDRQDILARAKTEWHFVILSSKLYKSYADEVDQIKERVDELKDFDGAIWEEMKSFWKKVQNQVQEKNLFREHAAELRTKTNEVFDDLKSLKKAMNDEFEKLSRNHLDDFMNELKNIDERIEKGLGLQPLFNELKDLQRKFRDTKFTRKHHNDVWKKLDGAFKKIKEKRFGESADSANNPVSRLTRRYDGLLNAIDKMEKSIARDVKDKEFQERRINTTDGQLELQIRQAKMAMIIERISSKQLKLEDMLKTRGELEVKIKAEQTKAEKRAKEKERAIQVKKAKETVKENIAKEIQEKAEELDDQKLEKAAEEIKQNKLSKKNIMTAPVVDISSEENESKLEYPNGQDAQESTEIGATDSSKSENTNQSKAIVEPTEEQKSQVAEIASTIVSGEEE